MQIISKVTFYGILGLILTQFTLASRPSENSSSIPLAKNFQIDNTWVPSDDEGEEEEHQLILEELEDVNYRLLFCHTKTSDVFIHLYENQLTLTIEDGAKTESFLSPAGATAKNMIENTSWTKNSVWVDELTGKKKQIAIRFNAQRADLVISGYEKAFSCIRQ